MCQWEMRWEGIFSVRAQTIQVLKGKSYIIQWQGTQIRQTVMPSWSVVHSLLILQSTGCGYGNSKDSAMLNSSTFQMTVSEWMRGRQVTCTHTLWILWCCNKKNKHLLLNFYFITWLFITEQTQTRLYKPPKINTTIMLTYSLAKSYQVIHLYQLSADKKGVYNVETMMSDYNQLHLYFLNKSFWAAWSRRWHLHDS